MATCKDCIHNELCMSLNVHHRPNAHFNEICRHFGDKSKFKQLPFIAMIEQTIIDGKPNFNKSNSSKNGMYCVVYSDPTKWAAPLIDICGKYHYKVDEAETRCNELRAKQEE